jgi:hypothetical protein
MQTALAKASSAVRSRTAGVNIEGSWVRGGRDRLSNYYGGAMREGGQAFVSFWWTMRMRRVPLGATGFSPLCSLLKGPG